ncbi:single-stranded DNA-binding protein [Sinorhizobium fredii]|uniref:single-stranded DNA-binding protein n=1 Tax=Rhizobium fredii TaxID=380 RepID=UPI003514D123
MGRNCAEFHIIGNVARIAKLEKVTKVTVAANLRAKINNEWQDDTHFNTVNIWDKKDRDYIETEIKVGDLVRVTGRMRESSFQDSRGETNYSVDLHANDFARLAKKSEKPD